MTLFTLLLVLILECLFKLDDTWQLDKRVEVLFRQLTEMSLLRTLLFTAIGMGVLWSFLWLIDELFFDALQFLLWILVGLLCIGAGQFRQHYRTYLMALGNGDMTQADHIARHLILIDRLPINEENISLSTVQDTLLWINFRYWLAPLFWFVVCGAYGPIVLSGYAFLRAWQRWLIHLPLQRMQSGIDSILYWLDWIPVRIAGAIYTLFGRRDKALSVWVTSLGDFHTRQYQVLTQLAQLSLVHQQHQEPVKTVKATVSLARKVTWVIIILLAIYAALV